MTSQRVQLSERCSWKRSTGTLEERVAYVITSVHISLFFWWHACLSVGERSDPLFSGTHHKKEKVSRTFCGFFFSLLIVNPRLEMSEFYKASDVMTKWSQHGHSTLLLSPESLGHRYTWKKCIACKALGLCGRIRMSPIRIKLNKPVAIRILRCCIAEVAKWIHNMTSKPFGVKWGWTPLTVER